MKRLAATGLSLLLVVVTACGGSSAPAASGGVLNLAGTWTLTTASTQSHAGMSGTATVTQSGQGLGTSGSTTLAAPVGQIVVTQTGTALSGTIITSRGPTSFPFTGSLSSSALTASGSIACPATHVTQTTSISGTATSSSIQGTYTIVRGTGCYGSNDAGTFVATRK